MSCCGFFCFICLFLIRMVISVIYLGREFFEKLVIILILLMCLVCDGLGCEG